MSEAGETVPERYRRLVKDRFALVLRELGFTGWGRIFVLPDERDWVMLGFQSSTASNPEWVKFTINLLVVGKQAWAEARKHSSHLSAKPSPNILGPHRYAQRIGHLTHGADRWWRLDARENPEPLVTEVSAAIRDVAVPKLRQEMSDQSPGPRGTFERVRKG